MGRPAGKETFEPTGDAYLRVLDSVLHPDCRFASGAPVFKRVAVRSDVPVMWVKRAWADGWREHCTDTVTWEPLAKRAMSSQLKARARAEDNRNELAEKTRVERQKAEAQAVAVMADESKLTDAARQNVKALQMIFQRLLVPMHNKLQHLAVMFDKEDFTDMSVDDFIQRLGKMTSMARMLNGLTAEVMTLERTRIGAPGGIGDVAGQMATGGASSSAAYPETNDEALEHIVIAQRAAKRALERGLVQVGTDLSPEVATIMRTDFLDAVGTGVQGSEHDDDEDTEGGDDDGDEQAGKGGD